MKIFSLFWDNLNTIGMIYFLTVSKISPVKSLGPGAVVVGVKVGRVRQYLNFSLAIGILSFSIPFKMVSFRFS